MQNSLKIHTKLVEQALVAVPPPPSRFTLENWHLNNRYRNRICLDQQKLADSTRLEVDRAIEQIGEITDLNKKDVDHKLHEKVDELHFNKVEIEKQRKEVCIEMENLNLYMERIKDCMNALREDSLKVVRKCLTLREERLGIDLCVDEVEKELKKELVVIEGAQNLLTRTMEEASEQVRI